MGHHHRKRRNDREGQGNLSETVNQNPQTNMDLSSMLGSLNLDNVDLSKIDFSQVQSMMDRIKSPENNAQGKSEKPENPENINTQRIALLNSIRPFLPPTRVKAMDSITKLLQIASLMGNSKASNR